VNTRPEEIPISWSEGNQTRTVALNVGGRYVNLSVELLVGLLMLPFKTRYLGASEYGLWMLAASIVAYFPILDLGYGVAMERFVAYYRTQRSARAINEIASTLVFVFAGIGLVGFGLLAVIAMNLGRWFDLPLEQARSGGVVMMLVGAQFAIGLPFAIFGAIVNGFQRQYLNAAVGSTISIAVAIVNVAVVFAGGSLEVLVAAMTAVRMTGYLAYRLNAYRVFPPLRIRPSLFRIGRLKEVSRFSVYMLVQDLSVKANYATDPVVIAAVLMTGAVAVWTIAQRLADVVLQLTNQLNHVLFPIVVDADSARRDDRLQEVLVQGTRLSLATVLPVAGSLALLAHPVVIGWTGPEYAAAALIVPILCLVVIVRVGTWTASTVLVGAGHHRLVAGSNLVAAAANIGLSILLIHWYGLPGVAVATLIPVVLRGATIILPTACRRVGLPLLRFLRTAIWPALWPAVLALGVLLFVRDTASASLWGAVLKGVFVGIIHAVLFLGIAVGREDRNRYLGKLRMIAGRPVLKAA
jgi:O-antigen/teichoic acid export membrane protein